MIFLKISELAAAVLTHQLSNHQIKGKRIKKELSNLEEYKRDQLTFKKYMLTPYGISFFIETHYKHRLFDFEIFIDNEYPFNRPQVFYQQQHSSYGYGQDLLDNLLDGGNWGPSMLLNAIFDKLPLLAQLIFQESQNLIALYHVNDFYEEQILSRYKVELFRVDEFQWKYMIKSTFKKVLGLTKETLLKFTMEDNKLKLQSSIKIKDIKQANASINNHRFKLDIIQTTKLKYCFGGDQADIQKILYFMNPIQVIERKLTKSKQSKKSQNINVEQEIKQYSELIEYYSLRDPEKTKNYVNLIQGLIKDNYESMNKEQKKLEELQEDIKA